MRRTRYVADMATKPKKVRRLFLREHREAAKISAPAMAKVFGIGRISLLRIEREPHRLDHDGIAKYAGALGLEPGDLYHPPGEHPARSIDGMLANQPESVRKLAADLIARLIEPPGE